MNDKIQINTKGQTDIYETDGITTVTNSLYTITVYPDGDIEVVAHEEDQV